jgi:hypothetical protein
VKAFGRIPLVPFGLVTETLTAPAACAGVVALSWVELTNETPVAGVPPNETVAPLAKFDPVMTTGVPPDIDPVLGETLLIVIEADVYLNALGSEAEFPLESDTCTLTLPAAWGGTTTLNWSELMTVT